MQEIVPLEFETIPGRPERDIDSVIWRPDHDGGDEDAECHPSTTVRVDQTLGTFNWWVNSPHSPCNLKPFFMIGRLL